MEATICQQELKNQIKESLGETFNHPLWTPNQVAKLLQVNVRSLANDRWARKGLPYIKMHGKIYYDRETVLELLEDSRVEVEV
jgi:hypothetical protein